MHICLNKIVVVVVKFCLRIELHVYLVEQLGVEPSPFASEAAVLETACASRTPLLNY